MVEYIPSSKLGRKRRLGLVGCARSSKLGHERGVVEYVPSSKLGQKRHLGLVGCVLSSKLGHERGVVEYSPSSNLSEKGDLVVGSPRPSALTETKTRQNEHMDNTVNNVMIIFIVSVFCSLLTLLPAASLYSVSEGAGEAFAAPSTFREIYGQCP